MPKQKIDRDELLRRIELNGGPKGLDLSDHDLSGVDIGPSAIQRQLEERGLDPVKTPWVTMNGDREPRVNLAEIKLDGGELKFANLQRADMYHASLHDVNLARGELEGAELVWANLSGATLIAANLRGADLTRANLEGAEMAHANLDEVTWFGAFLNRTRITKQQLGLAIQEELKARRSKKPGAYRDAADTYRTLKTNFVSLGDDEGVSWALRKERTMEQAMLWQQGHRVRAFLYVARQHRNVAIAVLTLSTSLVGTIVALLTFLA